MDDNRAPIRKLDPDHPDADAQGYINLPNINIVEEMVNMISASRSYEANVTAVNVTKEMASEALDIGR
ncbi:MAG: flagellar basal body rod C-terminal domain-containing protein [Desulfosarcinaceae bacterium]